MNSVGTDRALRVRPTAARHGKGFWCRWGIASGRGVFGWGSLRMRARGSRAGVVTAEPKDESIVTTTSLQVPCQIARRPELSPVGQLLALESLVSGPTASGSTHLWISRPPLGRRRAGRASIFFLIQPGDCKSVTLLNRSR